MPFLKEINVGNSSTAAVIRSSDAALLFELASRSVTLEPVKAGVAMDTVVNPLKEFAKNSVRLVKRCTKPDRRGTFVGVGFLAPRRQ